MARRNVFGGDMCLGHQRDMGWTCTCATMEEVLRHVDGAMTGATEFLTEETCSGCGKQGLLLDGPRPWVCSECEMRRETSARRDGIATQLEAWKSKWAQLAMERDEALRLMGVAVRSDLVAAVKALVGANERLAEAARNRYDGSMVQELERQVTDLIGTNERLRTLNEGYVAERVEFLKRAPTARQAESGPSAVASAKPAAPRRPLVVYSEDD